MSLNAKAAGANAGFQFYFVLFGTVKIFYINLKNKIK